mmetsp:Transcript_79451/g.192363  ORF Transcript_79451/g.192363 Transcript_79451/m.192363 type:complete len:430 (+) Transcript_79451:744-2033(+)
MGRARLVCGMEQCVHRVEHARVLRHDRLHLMKDCLGRGLHVFSGGAYTRRRRRCRLAPLGLLLVIELHGLLDVHLPDHVGLGDVVRQHAVTQAHPVLLAVANPPLHLRYLPLESHLRHLIALLLCLPELTIESQLFHVERTPGVLLDHLENARVVALGERTLLLLVDTLFHAVALRELARGVDLVGVRQQGRHETLERGEAIGAEQPPLELAQVRRALDAKGGHPRSLGHAVYGRVVVVREVHVLDALPVDAVEEGLLTLEATQAVVGLLLELCVRAVDHHLPRGGDVGHLEQAHQWRHRHAVDHDREQHHEQRHRHHHKRLVAAVERFELVTMMRILNEMLAQAPHLLVIDRVLDDEGEREADRATQPAPPHDHRVPPRGARAHALEERKGDEDGKAAREEHDGVDQKDTPAVDLEDLVRGAVHEEHA